MINIRIDKTQGRLLWSNQGQLVGLGFVKKKILRIPAGTAKILATWFSQYSGLKVQNFAIIDQLRHASHDWCQ
jgi:hypothetical protein